MTGEFIGKGGENGYRKNITVSTLALPERQNVFTVAKLGKKRPKRKESGEKKLRKLPDQPTSSGNEWDIMLGTHRDRLSEDRTRIYLQAILNTNFELEQQNAQTQVGETIEVPVATAPKTFFTHLAIGFAKKYSADTELMREKLLSFGFDEQLASSFAVIFLDKSEVAGIKHLDAHAFYNSNGILTTEDENPSYYRMAFLLVCRDNEEEINNSFWHEVGHGYDDKVKGIKARDSWYIDQKVIKRTQHTGLATEIAGVLVGAGGLVSSGASAVADTNPALGLGGMAAGAALVAIGATLNITPTGVLRHLDSHERHANRFSRHNSNTRVIHIED